MEHEVLDVLVRQFLLRVLQHFVEVRLHVLVHHVQLKSGKAFTSFIKFFDTGFSISLIPTILLFLKNLRSFISRQIYFATCDNAKGLIIFLMATRSLFRASVALQTTPYDPLPSVNAGLTQKLERVVVVGQVEA